MQTTALVASKGLWLFIGGGRAESIRGLELLHGFYKRPSSGRVYARKLGARNLAVLRNNSAHAEVLVEVRNVHDTGEAYALRFHDKREEDVDRIFQGILNYAK